MTGFDGTHYRVSVRLITEVSVTVTWALVTGWIGVYLRTLGVSDMGFCLDSLKIPVLWLCMAVARLGGLNAGSP